jgi:hypothetical protein
MEKKVTWIDRGVRETIKECYKQHGGQEWQKKKQKKREGAHLVNQILVQWCGIGVEILEELGSL